MGPSSRGFDRQGGRGESYHHRRRHRIVVASLLGIGGGPDDLWQDIGNTQNNPMKGLESTRKVLEEIGKMRYGHGLTFS